MTPREILSAFNDQCGRVQLQYSTEKGLGNGGFRVIYRHNGWVQPGDYRISIDVYGYYVNPLGPFRSKCIAQ